MPADPNGVVQKAVDVAINERGEIGLQVAAYLHGKLAVDVWGGLADDITGRVVDGDTIFPVFSVIKAVTAVALHIQAERGYVDYYAPVAQYWPEFGAHGKGQGDRVRCPHSPHRSAPDARGGYTRADVRLGLDGEPGFPRYA